MPRYRAEVEDDPIVPPKPQKLRPIDDEEQKPKSALKSSGRVAASSPTNDDDSPSGDAPKSALRKPAPLQPEPPSAPKSALRGPKVDAQLNGAPKSALKGGAPNGAPEPASDKPKSALKSSHQEDLQPVKPVSPQPPQGPKSALKCRQQEPTENGSSCLKGALKHHDEPQTNGVVDSAPKSALKSNAGGGGCLKNKNAETDAGAVSDKPKSALKSSAPPQSENGSEPVKKSALKHHEEPSNAGGGGCLKKSALKQHKEEDAEPKASEPTPVHDVPDCHVSSGLSHRGNNHVHNIDLEEKGGAQKEHHHHHHQPAPVQKAPSEQGAARRSVMIAQGDPLQVPAPLEINTAWDALRSVWVSVYNKAAREAADLTRRESTRRLTLNIDASDLEFIPATSSVPEEDSDEESDDEYKPQVMRTCTVIIDPESSGPASNKGRHSHTMQIKNALARHDREKEEQEEEENGGPSGEAAPRNTFMVSNKGLEDEDHDEGSVACGKVKSSGGSGGSKERTSQAGRMSFAGGEIPNFEDENDEYGAEDGTHPLKEALCASKKVNTKKLKTDLEGIPVATKRKWLNTPLDFGPPVIPAPLFFAVGLQQSGVVTLLVEHNVDVRKRFNAEKMHGGWVKPGLRAIESVSQRKYRFVGTVLGERLEAIEDILKLEEDRLRGWNASLNNKSKTKDEKVEDAVDDVVATMDEAEEAKMEEKAKEVQKAKGIDPAKVGRRKSIYTSAANVVSEHIEGHPSEKYNMTDRIGEGTFGSVRKGEHKVTKQIRAIKAVPKQLVEEADMWQEIEIMRKIDHPHCVKLFETFEDELHVFMIFELCKGGELFDRLLEEGNFSERQASRVMKQILGAISYLHHHRICHRDLKPENFLLLTDKEADNAHVKIIDFGTAKEFGPNKPMKTKICTLHYVAPEILTKKEVAYTERCDVWSLGVIMYLMLSGSPPFYGDTDIAVLKKIRNGSYKWRPASAWACVSQDAKDLIGKMLVVNPNDRFTGQEAYENRWIQEQAPEKAGGFDEKTIRSMRQFRAQNRLKKVALQMIAQQLSDDSVEDLRSLFASLDKTGMGMVKVKDIEKSLESSDQLGDKKEEMMRVLWEMDHGSGEVNYTHFLAATLDRQRYLQEEACRAAFDIFDLDGNGNISRDEMAQVLKGEGLTPEDGGLDSQGLQAAVGSALNVNYAEIEKIIEENDTDGDGEISFPEFMAMMAKQQHNASSTTTSRTMGPI